MVNVKKESQENGKEKIKNNQNRKKRKDGKKNLRKKKGNTRNQKQHKYSANRKMYESGTKMQEVRKSNRHCILHFTLFTKIKVNSTENSFILCILQSKRDHVFIDHLPQMIYYFMMELQYTKD